ncbi:hypothetical protein R1flu_000716 [Riccia fluitans]|uniref:Uncharacterized protein n=1 Tax=Riccia fluitans TaxID=41844 RepID=A0ABD1Y179_9MARC
MISYLQFASTIFGDGTDDDFPRTQPRLGGSNGTRGVSRRLGGWDELEEDRAKARSERWPMESTQSFPALVCIGASQPDVGFNNNVQSSVARAKLLPYGQDFINGNRRGPTGHFSNGKILPDLLVSAVMSISYSSIGLGLGIAKASGNLLPSRPFFSCCNWV